MLTVQNLDKSFATGAGPVHAVRDVSFSANNGEMVAILGASGSGKSTLLALLGLLDAPDKGSIDIDGVELANLDGAGRTQFRARGVGFVFQQFNLIPNLSAKENVKLALEFAQWPKGDRDRRADEMLSMVGLDAAKADRRPAKLSGGEQQRVAVARAFMLGPEILLADEPTGNLDTTTGDLVLDLLRRTATELSVGVIMATHSAESAAVVDRVIRLRDGRMEA